MFDLDTFSNICVYLKNTDIYNLLLVNKFIYNYNRDELYMNYIHIYFNNMKLKTFNYKLNYKVLYKELIIIRKLPKNKYSDLTMSKLWELFLYSINNLLVDILIFALSRETIPISKYFSSINLLINNLNKSNIEKTLLCFNILIKSYPGPINYKNDTYIKLLLKLISLNLNINITTINIDTIIRDDKNKIIKKIISTNYKNNSIINIDIIKYKFDIKIFQKIIHSNLLNYYINNLSDTFVLDDNVMKLLTSYNHIYNSILLLNNIKIFNINKLISYLLKHEERELLEILFKRGHINNPSSILIKKMKQHNFIKILQL